ncbi:MAG TPA: serine hydrolase domain-containing protein [Burkholderiales bacterium]|jgi:CubicO group peptidase (beta-lactamase class C family)|nr:serine hydrolase domain-containing protein [Burkholderiales bacterium]
MTIPIRIAFMSILWAACAAFAAAPLPQTAPQDVGISPERLARLTAVYQRAVDSGELPGAVIMIARDGKLAYAKALGWQDKARNVAMKEDSIFRIYSMTKPVVSVAAMILVEEGLLGLHEPISKYLPEFKDMKVGVEGTDAAGQPTFTRVDAKRQITVQDLLRHTSGLTYGAFVQRTAVQRLYKDAGLWSQKWILEDFCKALAKLPLQHEPGTTWEYGHSTDVLGRVVEVVSGKPLDRFLAERIFMPLGMNDTAFHVPAGKHARLAEPIPDKYTGTVPELIDVRQPATFFAGGHGLVSTAGDYLRFTQMLLNGGELDGVRILGPRTVEYMASNHLHEKIAKGTNYLPGPGYGFGLGFATRLEVGMSEWPGSVGEFFWGGYAGTYFWIDPEANLAVTYMSQEPARRNHYRVLLRNTVYQAIIQ